MELPWATLDPQGCPYLSHGGGWRQTHWAQQLDDLVFPDGYQGCSGQGGTSRLQLPILVEHFYPANTYSVQYYIKVTIEGLQHWKQPLPKVRDEQIACIAFPLRICDEGKCAF